MILSTDDFFLLSNSVHSNRSKEVLYCIVQYLCIESKDSAISTTVVFFTPIWVCIIYFCTDIKDDYVCLFNVIIKQYIINLLQIL